MITRATVRLMYRAWRYRLRHDPGEIRFMLRCLQPGDIAIDIGAHKGAYTYWMARRIRPHGRVFAFEPQPRLAASLRELAARLATDGSIRVENLAVSSVSGAALLHVPDGDASPGATIENREATWGNTAEVKTVTLDEYFADLSAAERIAFIKCDVEGHELEVFRGARRILTEHRPILLFECEARHRADRSVDRVFDYLQLLNYEGFQFDIGGHLSPIFSSNEPTSRALKVGGNNFAFLPRSSDRYAAVVGR